jgi:hypothetical protein
MDRVMDKLDLNAIMSRVDLTALVQQTEMGSIIAATGSSVAGKALDVARSQGVGLDFFVQRWYDRLFRRKRSPQPGGPEMLIHELEPVVS